MIEEQSGRGKQWLESLLQFMGLPAQVQIGKVEHSDVDACWLIIDETKLSQEQIDILIGEKGEGIDAIQYLANTLLNLGTESEEQMAFTVELNGYRIKRQAELMALAKEVAQQVRQTGQEVEMKALSSAERRQIHTFLKDAEDLETESRGQEPDRRLIVRLR
ncbi:MAG: RNA-binding protein [Hydrococcus sp. Prado102]|jgi:spoIIIJ-associated protein|nr:RNA-binding protein [Hydrococcus sp. Prado102]